MERLSGGSSFSHVSRVFVADEIVTVGLGTRESEQMEVQRRGRNSPMLLEVRGGGGFHCSADPRRGGALEIIDCRSLITITGRCSRKSPPNCCLLNRRVVVCSGAGKPEPRVCLCERFFFEALRRAAVDSAAACTCKHSSISICFTQCLIT